MGVTTLIGVVRNGQIALIDSAPLIEGSQVYVVIPDTLDGQTARRKANRWLVENVGNMVMADHPTSAQENGRSIWRLGAFVTSLSREPRGPIGYVDVDAVTGQVLNTHVSIEEMIQRGEHLADSTHPAKE